MHCLSAVDSGYELLGGSWSPKMLQVQGPGQRSIVGKDCDHVEK